MPNRARHLLVSALVVALASAACSSPSSKPASGDAGTTASADPERCATCHMDAFRGVANPVHVGTRPDTCAICHTEKSWQPSVLSHPWPLTGAHLKASCFACHKGAPSTFKSTAKDCFACHKPDYQRAPNHVARKFSTKCASCHQTNAWADRLGLP